jgi:hypothetical protein
MFLSSIWTFPALLFIAFIYSTFVLFYVITIHSNTLDQGFCDVGRRWVGIRVSSKDFVL